MAEIVIASRVDKALYGKILKRQRHLKKLTGIEPSVSAVVRSMIEEAAKLDDELESARVKKDGPQTPAEFLREIARQKRQASRT